MKKKILFTMSLLFALVLLGGFAYLVFPGARNIFVKNSAKTMTISNLESEKPIEDTSQNVQPEKTELNSESESNSVETLPVAVSEPAKKPTPSVDVKTDKTNKTDSDVQDTSGKIVQQLVSFGFQKSSGRTIKAIIIHTSYNNIGGDVFDFKKVLQEWKDAGVSPHYAIDREGTIYQLVADQNIAWHAGVSKLPDGTTDVNGASIGIEVVNDQNSKFSDAEYSALNSLIVSLKKKYPIKYVLGHDDIAPGRKTDPWGIEWGKVRK